LDPQRKNPITTTGHADLVQTQTGKWYAVFLGCRPYEGSHYNIGRETFLNPVTWTTDGWPVITKGTEEVQYRYPLPLPEISSKQVDLFTGNFTFRDEFTDQVLDRRYMFLRTVTDKWYSTTDKRGTLSMLLRPQTMSGKENPSFVGFRQQHHRGVVTTKLEFVPAGENEKAGLLIFQNEAHYYYLCKSISAGKGVVQLLQAGEGGETLVASRSLASIGQDIYLRIEPDSAIYRISFSTDGKVWAKLKDVDATFLSTATAGGFVGSVFGMYATSSGKPSSTKANYDWFEYEGNDDVFK
jgi:alpha-N-arabinofuranosidase